MRNKVSDILKVIGRHTEVGTVMPHARDGVRDGGMTTSKQRHNVKVALHKQRMRASGMTDYMFGAKEVGGRFENVHEKEV